MMMMVLLSFSSIKLKFCILLIFSLLNVNNGFLVLPSQRSTTIKNTEILLFLGSTDYSSSSSSSSSSRRRQQQQKSIQKQGGLRRVIRLFETTKLYYHHDGSGDDDDGLIKLNQLLGGIDILFPPQNLQERMALSRKDGYWPFIQSGEEPPQEFVYGEFDVGFFCSVLDRARQILQQQQQQQQQETVDNNTNNNNNDDDDDLIFCDMGSGTGRLVLAAAAWHKWKLCRGIELLEGIHDQAIEKLESCRRHGRKKREDDKDDTGDDDDDDKMTSSTQGAYWRKQYSQPCTSTTDAWLDQLSNNLVGGGDDRITTTNNEEEDNNNEGSSLISSNDDDSYFALQTSDDSIELPLCPIDLSCGSFDDPYEFFGDSNIIFVFSTAMPYHILVNLARAIGRQCMVGCLVITTEYQLPLGGIIEPYEDDPNLPHGPYELELVESFSGENLSVGGVSTVFIHRVTKSYGTGQPFVKPKISVSDYAYKVVQDLDSGKLTPDPQTFIRNVSNQMAFIGLPYHWRPKLN